MDSQSSHKVIAIDGPGGSGKSTLAQNLAQALGWVCLDTGAIYRVVALVLTQKGLVSAGEKVAGEVARNLNLTFEKVGFKHRLFLDGQDPGETIRTPEITTLASKVSALPEVRTALLPLQRSLGQAGELIAEGRDMGTVVFPQAGLKFFLEASPEIRAKRRFLELTQKGENVTYSEVLARLKARDQADATRSLAPLTKAPGAVVLDSSCLTASEVFEVAKDKAIKTFNLSL
ncbi:MAG: (d)CMP kinase [Deltaproteobacteria bacterium]|jgi:cytidylate kinase|nr:(d)CMP kinase [Deltaproteobacteria bacterium]